MELLTPEQNYLLLKTKLGTPCPINVFDPYPPPSSTGDKKNEDVNLMHKCIECSYQKIRKH